MRLFRFKSLQSRLLFIFLSLFLAVGLSAFLMLARVHERSARAQIGAELTQSSRVISAFIAARLETHRQASSILSKDYAFQQAFSTGDMATVSSAMESLRRRTGADTILLLSIEDSREVLAGSPRSELAGKAFPQPELVARAEESGKVQPAFINLSGSLHSVTIVPILAPEPLVWFCIGFRMDDRFFAELRELVPSDITLAEAGTGALRICASTLGAGGRKALADAVSGGALKKETTAVKIGEDQFLFQSILLDEKSGAWLLIQRSLDDALRPFRRLQAMLVAIGAAGLLITLLGGMAISRNVSRPIRTLAERSREVAKGNYGEPVAVGSEDEVGELEASFNRMINGLDERDRIHDLLGKVVSPEIAGELLKSREIALGGEEKEATILFSDIRDFTTLCEGRAPAEVLEMLNHYLTRMNDIIERHGGVVDKFIGDAIMALFGTPVRQEDHAGRAMAAALDMIGELADINRALAEKGFPELRIGIGVNTGIVVAGNMGSRNRLNYTVIGDDVNLASRLESECKAFKKSIIISEKTLERAGERYAAEYLGEVKVKGKKEATKIYALLGNSQ